MKIGVVGAGFVGATAAYALVLRGIGRDLVLIDYKRERAAAEADDILHAVPFAHPLNVNAGDYPDLAGCKLVLLAAGVNQQPGETRLQLLGRNARIFEQIVPQVLAHAPEAILIVATNPVDVMTHLAARVARNHGVNSSRVIGTGTTLDTARFRTLLARHVGIDAQHVHAYVIGEHGDSEVLTWSLATVAGFPLEHFCRQHGIPLDESVKEAIDTRVRRAAYSIIAGKGATYYGVGAAIARIVHAVLHDQRAVLTVSGYQEEVAGVEDVTLALPHLVGGQGILESFSLPLSHEEHSGLHRSAGVIKQAIENLPSA